MPCQGPSRQCLGNASSSAPEAVLRGSASGTPRPAKGSRGSASATSRPVKGPRGSASGTPCPARAPEAVPQEQGGGREGRGCTSILRNLNCRDHAGLQAHEHGHPSIPGAWLPLVPPGSTWLLKTISWVSLGLPVAPLGSSWLPLAPPGSSWQILASSPGTSWLLLAPPGSFSLLVAARGYFWLLLGGRSKTYDGDCWKNRL